MGIVKKQYKQPTLNVRRYEECILTSSSEGDPFKDPSRVDIYSNLLWEE